MGYTIGDVFIDKNSDEIIEIIGIKNKIRNGIIFDVKIDDIYWEYGVSNKYLEKECLLVKRTKVQRGGEILYV